MKKYIILTCLLLLICGCQNQSSSQMEIEDHIFVEKEYKESWLEIDERGKTYLQLTIDGGHFYQTDKRYLNIFYKDGGRIVLYNFSIKKDNMMISGEFIPEKKTILLVHPHLENVTCEGVLMHELGHYFDDLYQFSSSKEFLNLYKNNKKDDIFNDKKERNESEFFADMFKEYTANKMMILPNDLQIYMEKICQKILENK